MPLAAFSPQKLSQHLRRWSHRTDELSTLDLASVEEDRAEARELRAQLNRYIDIADRRLSSQAHQPLELPYNADWIWRPDMWRGLSPLPQMTMIPQNIAFDETVTLYHDCALGELSCKAAHQDGTHPHRNGLDIGVFHFEGTFLSLAVNFPEKGAKGLGRSHILEVALELETETQLEVFARLNLKHGPNSEQMVQELASGTVEKRFEFDMAYSNLRERPVDRIWLDLIFEKPRMNRVILSDLTVTRRHRAHV